MAREDHIRVFLHLIASFLNGKLVSIADNYNRLTDLINPGQGIPVPVKRQIVIEVKAP